MLRLLLASSLLSLAAAAPGPAITPAPAAELAREALERRQNFIPFTATTGPVDSDFYIGLSSVIWECKRPYSFTVDDGFAGCGQYLMTTCDGSTAMGPENTITCVNSCYTHGIYEDRSAFDASSSTPFVFCGTSVEVYGRTADETTGTGAALPTGSDDSEDEEEPTAGGGSEGDDEDEDEPDGSFRHAANSQFALVAALAVAPMLALVGM